MKRDKVRQKAVIGILHSAQPEWVSLVKRGANQRAFHATKSGRTKQEETTMKGRTALKSAASAAVAVARIKFDATVFKDAEAVSEWLVAKGYSEFEVLPAEGGFVVDYEAGEAVPETIRAVTSRKEAGVTYEIGDRVGKTAPDPEAGDGGDAAGEDAGAPGAAGEAEGSAGEAPEGEAGGDEGGEGEAGEGAEGEEAPEGTGEAPEGTAGGDEAPEGGADAGDGEAAPAPAEAPAATTTEVEVEVATKAVRKRHRPGRLQIADLSLAAYVAKCEEFAEAMEEASTTRKSFADNVANYTGGTPPGLYTVSEAFIEELVSLVRTGRADEGSVASLSGELTRAVMALHGAYSSILTGSNVAKGAQVVQGGEGDDAAVDAVIQSMLGAPASEQAGDETQGVLKALRDDVARMAEALTATVVKSDLALKHARALYDAAAIGDIEEGDGEETPALVRILPGRKSDTAPVVPAEEEAEEVEEQREEAKRAAKRLGFMA